MITSGKSQIYKRVGRSFQFLVIACLGVIFFYTYGCGERQTAVPTRAFYYWKSTMFLPESQKSTIARLQVRKLYVKFFDVVWNEASQTAMPVAKVVFDDSIPGYLVKDSIEIIPTVFITNECFLKLDSVQIDGLARQVNNLLHSLLTNNQVSNALVREIQFDCDWTATTKAAYFRFLQQMKTLHQPGEFLFSATVRLYQCKYVKKTGVPPVDRGLLMCYNMGNLRDASHRKNSILDLDDLASYTAGLSSYPLPLDVAFPLFDWKVLFRANAFSGLIQNLPDSLLANPRISAQTGNIFTILEDTVIGGYDFKKDDVLRNEKSEPEQVAIAASMLNKKLKQKNITISLYHLDSATLKNYTIHELENIYNSIH